MGAAAAAAAAASGASVANMGSRLPPEGVRASGASLRGDEALWIKRHRVPYGHVPLVLKVRQICTRKRAKSR
jgi:hypothetical protein